MKDAERRGDFRPLLVEPWSGTDAISGIDRWGAAGGGCAQISAPPARRSDGGGETLTVCVRSGQAAEISTIT
jgi:hypothetical protein